MSGFQNILLIGASGAIGTVLLDELLKEPSFTLTVLQRASSKFQPPAHLKTITISDSYPTDDLITAFRGQDVIVNCMTTLSVSDQFRMDEGDRYFSCTTEENTAAGLIRALKIPEETKNQNLFLSDFAVTQKQLLAAIEKIQGVKYATKTIGSEGFIKEKQEAVRSGDKLATFALIETGFVTGKYGGYLEEELGEIMNERLGLPRNTLDGVVKNSLRALGLI